MMRAININVLYKKSIPKENTLADLACVECGKKEIAMAHIRMNPKNMYEGPHAMPLGGLYCSLCVSNIISMLAEAQLQMLKSER